MTWWLRLVALGAVAAAAAACASEGAMGEGGGSGEGGGGGATAGVTVAFEDAGVLSLAPGQAVDLTVTTFPPGAHMVTFLILGNAEDASLDRSTSETDVAGRASVTLQAPGKAAEFLVRAAVDGGPGAERKVRVTEVGTGVVKVTPKYASPRPVERWTAAVVAQATCAELAASSPTLPSVAVVASALPGEPLEVAGAPVGPALAVVVRSAEKAWGCATTTLHRAAETVEVEVSVLDRPLDRTALDLAVELGLSSVGPEVATLLDRAGDRLVKSAFPADVPAATVILDAMGPRLPTEIFAAFASARADGLDDALTSDLESREVAPGPLLEALLLTGRERFGGSIRGQLRATPGAPSHAVFALEEIAGVAATRAGAPTDHLVSFVANPGDTVVLGGALLFLPTRLAGALAEDAALEPTSPGTAWSDVLAEAVDCDAVAEVVGPIGDCDVLCMEASCRLGLGDRWAVSLDASAVAGDLGVLSVAASGRAEVDDQAALVGFDGEWVGVMTGDSRSGDLSGEAIASQTEDADGGP